MYQSCQPCPVTSVLQANHSHFGPVSCHVFPIPSLIMLVFKSWFSVQSFSDPLSVLVMFWQSRLVSSSLTSSCRSFVSSAQRQGIKLFFCSPAFGLLHLAAPALLFVTCNAFKMSPVSALQVEVSEVNDELSHKSSRAFWRSTSNNKGTSMLEEREKGPTRSVLHAAVRKDLTFKSNDISLQYYYQ